MVNISKFVKLFFLGIITVFMIIPITHEIGHIFAMLVTKCHINRVLLFSDFFVEGNVLGLDRLSLNFISVSGTAFTSVFSLLPKSSRYEMFFIQTVFEITSVFSVFYSIVSVWSSFYGVKFANCDFANILLTSLYSKITIVTVMIGLDFVLIVDLIMHQPLLITEKYFNKEQLR